MVEAAAAVSWVALLAMAEAVWVVAADLGDRCSNRMNRSKGTKGRRVCDHMDW